MQGAGLGPCHDRRKDHHALIQVGTTTRLWHTSTLAEELNVTEADENDLYRALGWLLQRQPRIEKRLAAKHLSEGAVVLYDVTSAHYEGHTCPLVRDGHARGGKKGCPIVVFGLLTDTEGTPVSVGTIGRRSPDRIGVFIVTYSEGPGVYVIRYHILVGFLIQIWKQVTRIETNSL